MWKYNIKSFSYEECEIISHIINRDSKTSRREPWFIINDNYEVIHTVTSSRNILQMKQHYNTSEILKIN